MAYDENKLAKLKALKELATRVQTRLEALEDGGTAIKAATVDGNTLKFFDTTDTATATATYTIDLPAEMFLDAASTSFVPNFTFNSETYSGATNPNLDGKPVMVLGVKTKSNDGLTITVTYSFIDVSALVDTYTSSDTSVTISDYKAKVNISAAANNSITLQNDGLHVDVTDKVDKVTTATAGNIAAFVTGGGISDSGYSVATDAEVTEMLNEILGS